MRGHLPVVLASGAMVLCFQGALQAQNIDSLILSNSKPFTVVDQISNPAERKAFQNIYHAHAPSEKVKRCESFLAQFPQSWLLADVYEIAAKASIDSGEFEQALRYGRASLQILPENPLLLVPLANVEINLGRRAESAESAREALAYLERFARPSTIAEKEWPRVQRELKASCFFVLGRVKTLQALDLPPGREKSKGLTESLDLLAQARSLNPDDPEIDYLAGLDYLGLGNLGEAEKCIAAATRGSGPVREMALAKLAKIFDQSRQNQKETFSQFLASFGQPDLPRPALAAATDAKLELPAYVGSKTCGTCHVDIYENWSHTGMARMLRPYRPENILGDFVADNVFYTGDEAALQGGAYKFIPGKDREPFARMIIDHGRHYFQIKQADGQWHRYAVDYTIGSKWQQAYVTRLPDGELQVLPIEYNLRYRKWVNFFKIIDAPGEERDDPHQWEKFGQGTNYKVNCAACHTSQLRNTKGGGFVARELEFREPGIDCEMCHGPGDKHVASLMQGKLYEKPPLAPPVDFSKISSVDSVAICSQCHMQSALRSGLKGELNYAREGSEFFRRYESRPFSEFYLAGRYKDGRFRQTTFIVESFLRSACFRKGGATCVSCHDPHHDDAASNPTSLRFRDRPNEMCVQCHTPFKNPTVLQQHTRHPLNSQGSQCASCHMPRIMEALMSLARTHRIDDIPNAQMTARFGEQDSPNACQICHTDKNASWVAQELEKGWKMRPASPELRAF
jgi:predicted CXXCH cytochrome family protein